MFLPSTLYTISQSFSPEVSLLLTWNLEWEASRTWNAKVKVRSYLLNACPHEQARLVST